MSNMTRGHKGMRKGISLVEMLIAIVLFGIIGTISYTYYKNYYDVSFAAKKLRIYTIVDQAAQLSNAFDLYNTKNGADPVTVQELVDDKILTAIPASQPFVTGGQWRLEQNLTIDTTATGTAFIYDLNSSVSTNQDKLDYCNILNNTAHNTWSLDSADTDIDTIAATWTVGDANISSELEFFHCADNNGTSTYDYQLVFVKHAEIL